MRGDQYYWHDGLSELVELHATKERNMVAVKKHTCHAVGVALMMLGASVPALGCGQQKITECNSLIEVINRGVKELEAGSKAAAASPASIEVRVEELTSMATAMDAVADDASKLQLTMPELRKFSTDYQAMARDIAKSARDMAAGASEKDAKRINDAQEAMEKAVTLEDPLVDALNKYCQKP